MPIPIEVIQQILSTKYNTDIVLSTLTAKLDELVKTDQQLDIDYSARKKEIRTNIEALKQAIAQFKDSRETKEYEGAKRGRKSQPNQNNEYPYTGSHKNKLFFAIKDSDRFLHIREIVDYILSKETPSYSKSALIDMYGKHIYKYKNDGLIIGVKIGSSHRNTVYGLPEWLDEHGNIIPEHTYNRDALIDKVSDAIHNNEGFLKSNGDRFYAIGLNSPITNVRPEIKGMGLQVKPVIDEAVRIK